jgi:hypothetical protein
MSALLIKIHQIHECLRIVCDVESDILNSSLLSLFKKKDFSGNESKLLIARKKLTELQTSLDAHLGNSSGIDSIVVESKLYIQALIISASKLLDINNRLHGKANGAPYSMAEYKGDINEFRSLQNNYCMVGERMNLRYRLYSHELASMK